MNFFVGLDWASQAHAVCVLDVAAGVLGSVEHSAEGLAELRRRLARFGRRLPPHRHRTPLGPRRRYPDGRRHPVVPIHPNALKRAVPLLRRGQ